MPSAATIESLEIEITSKSTGVVSHLRSLAQALAEIKPSTAKSGLSSIATGINRINDALKSFVGFQKLVDLRDTLSQIRGVAKQAADALAGFNREINNAPNIRAYKDLAHTIARMGGLGAFMNGGGGGSTPPPGISSDPSMLPSTKVFSGVPNVSDVDTGNFGEILDKHELILSGYRDTVEQEARFIDAAYEEIFDTPLLGTSNLETGNVVEELEDLEQPTEEVTQNFAELRSQIEDLGSYLSLSTISNGFRKLINMFKRILLYRVIRGVIQGITQAIKEGIDNLYQWSLLNDGVFAKSMDTLASCATNAKNALAVAFAPAINAIVPIVQMATNAIVTLGNAISWLFAKLKGAATYTRVNTDYMTQYGKAATSAGGAAGKAAKEMQRTILGFDEINKLNADTGGSSGGGGGGGGVSGSNYNDMFELANVEGAWQSFKDKVQDSVEKIRAAVDAFLDEHPKLKKIVGPALKFVRESWGALTQDITANTDFVNSKYKSFNDHTKQLSAQAGDNIKAFVEGSKTHMNSWADTVASKSESGMSKMSWSITKSLDSTKGAFTSWISSTKGIFNELTGAANDSLSEVEEKFLKTQDTISEFSTESQKSMSSFAVGVEEKAKQGMKGHTSNIYNGLMNSSDNISLWDSMTSKSMDSWASSTTSTVAGWAKSVVNSIANACQEAFNNIKSLASSTGAKYNLPSYTANKSVSTSTYSGSGGKGNWKSQQQLKLYAAGGFPIVGDLFIANERGPELVGSMNNRPAVANQQQIIEGISQGVARAMMTQEALLREQNDLLRSRGDVVVTTGSIVDSFNRMNRRSGTTVVPVGG